MYKFSYEFQPKDSRDFTLKSEAHPSNSNLQLVSATLKNGAVAMKATPALPPTFVIPSLPPILNQGTIGSCVANTFAYTVSKQTKSQVNLSRLCLYGVCRAIDNTPLNQDNGTTIRTACKAISEYGVCQESIYPYVAAGYSTLPSLTAFAGSRKFQKFTYFFVQQDLASIKSALTTFNSPIVFGIMVYSTFLTAKNGMIPMPNIQKDPLLGGHAVTMVGYNDTTKMFMCANSWGPSWGAKGYFYLPYDYVLSPMFAGDLCVTTFVF